MNQKIAFKTDAPKPEYLYEVKVNGTVLKRGMLITPHRRPNLIGGKWVFKFAECLGDTLALHVEGPIAREARHKVIRIEDIKTVHRPSKRGR